MDWTRSGEDDVINYPFSSLHNIAALFSSLSNAQEVKSLWLSAALPGEKKINSPKTIFFPSRERQRFFSPAETLQGVPFRSDPDPRGRGGDGRRVQDL